MSADDVVERLRKALDLTLYEAKLYLAILQGARDPKEASAQSGVPLPRIYDVVRVLESKGMVYRDSGGWYRAVSPHSLAAMSIIKLEEETKRRAKEIEELARVLESLAGKGQPSLTMVKGTYNIISAAVDYFRDSPIVYVVVGSVFLGSDILRKLVEAISQYVVDIRVMASKGSGQLDIGVHGVQVRYARAAYLDLVVSQQSVMTLMKDVTSDVLVAVLNRNPDHAGYIIKALSELWQEAQGVQAE